MTKVIYDSAPVSFSWQSINPYCIFRDLMKYKELIASMTSQNFRSTYQASYLGIAWQIILPLIMLAIFYFVFGVIMGGRFVQTAIESPLDYALALFVGLGFFNFVAQNIGSAPSLMMSNQVYVKTLAFPVEVIPLTQVLTSLLTVCINLALTMIILLLTKHALPLSAVMTVYYVFCILMFTLGISWVLSAIGVVVRDIAAIVSPLTIILMFMCPIFYPASMVPKKIKWLIVSNPVALVIEDARACLLYGTWPSLHAILYVGCICLTFAIIGYSFFMRSKNYFADSL